MLLLGLIILVGGSASSWTSHYYSSNKVNVPVVPTAFQQISKLSGSMLKEGEVTEKMVLAENSGFDWNIILITLITTVFAFWIGQAGMCFAARCPKWLTKLLTYCGCRKPKPRRRNPRANRKIAGKFCVYPLRRNRQLVAHIREPLRSK